MTIAPRRSRISGSCRSLTAVTRLSVITEPLDPVVVQAAIDALRAGAAIVLPTDTVYGLACLPTVSGAVDRLFVLKGRPADMPVAVLVASLDQAVELAVFSPSAARLADAFWPGPLTLVLPRRAGVDLPLGEPADTIGIRWPDHPVITALAVEVGPLATTSANRSGEPTPVHAQAASDSLDGPVGLVLDGGPCAGIASTVCDLTGPRPRVVRAGAITETDVFAALG